MNTYLYHAVPRDMRGHILYPLKTLKEKFPDLYEKKVAKYVGREHITQQRISPLNCLWNDVLHLSPVRPQDIKQALVEAGRDMDTIKFEYYQIDPRAFEPKNTIVYLYAHRDVGQEIAADNLTQYVPEELAQYSVMPQFTKDYYKEAIREGGRPLLYRGIPHILYKGELDVTNVPIVSV